MKCGRCGRSLIQDDAGNWYSLDLVTSGETGELVAADSDYNCLEDSCHHGPVIPQIQT